MKASSGPTKRVRAATPRAAAADAGPPFTNLRFAVGIEGLQSARAVEVIFPTARLVTLSRGRREVQFDSLTIRRGLTRSTDWYDWWNQARRSTRAPSRLVTVVIQKTSGAEGVRWLFPDSVPLAYSLSPLNALAGAAVIESLEVRVGGFKLFRRQ